MSVGVPHSRECRSGWKSDLKGPFILLTSLVLSGVSSGCIARDFDWRSSSSIPSAVAFEDQESANPRTVPAVAYPWQNLAQLQPGTRVAVYLENGARMLQKFRRFDDTRIYLDVNGIDRDQIIAVTAAPEDRLLNGVLMGSGIGMGSTFISSLLLGAPIEGALMGSVTGLAAGSGIGALMDAGWTRPQDPPVFLRGDTAAPHWKNWKVEVPSAEIINWIAGRKVQLMLQDGTYVKGQVEKGDFQTITVSVRESSDESYEDREVDLFVRDISTIIVRERLGGSLLSAGFGGGLLGFFSGMGIGALANTDAANETGIVAGAGVGAFLGSAATLAFAEYRNWREITLIVK